MPATVPRRRPKSTDSAFAGYRPFPDMQGRNRRQERLEVPILIRALELPKDVSLLEVGCGRGIGLKAFAECLTPRHRVGLDIDPSFLVEADRRLHNAGLSAELYHGDVRDMPFPDASFDLVVDFGTCFHIRHADKALAEIERVLRPGGTFVHETRISQLFSHPIRSFGRRMPFRTAPGLRLIQWRGLWAARRKIS